MFFLCRRNVQSVGLNSDHTRQSGVNLSPQLFSKYNYTCCNINIADSVISCNIAGVCFYILAYADDTVLLSASRRDLQSLQTVVVQVLRD